MTQWLTTACCCGEGEPNEVCATLNTCVSCGDLIWSVEGTLQKQLFGAGGTLVQTETWSLSVAALRTRAASGTACRWLNTSPGGGPDSDFLGYSGTYIREAIGLDPLVSVFNFAPVTGPPTSPPNQSPWQTDSQCSDVTGVEQFTFRIGGSGSGSTDWIAQDSNGDDVDVAFNSLTFARSAIDTCPIGVYDFVDPDDGFEYPIVPVLRSYVQ